MMLLSALYPTYTYMTLTAPRVSSLRQEVSAKRATLAVFPIIEEQKCVARKRGDRIRGQ